jgi:hypothetical protein
MTPVGVSSGGVPLFVDQTTTDRGALDDCVAVDAIASTSTTGASSARKAA